MSYQLQLLKIESTMKLTSLQSLMAFWCVSSTLTVVGRELVVSIELAADRQSTVPLRSQRYVRPQPSTRFS